MGQAGIERAIARLSQHRRCQLSGTSVSCQKAVSKTQSQWHDQGDTGQLTNRLKCTGVNFNTCVLILNCTLALVLYVCFGLIWMFWHRETHTTYKGTDKQTRTKRVLYLAPPDYVDLIHNVQTEVISLTLSHPLSIYMHVCICLCIILPARFFYLPLYLSIFACLSMSSYLLWSPTRLSSLSACLDFSLSRNFSLSMGLYD